MQKRQTDFETILDTTPVPTEDFVAPTPFDVTRLQFDLVTQMDDVEADWRRLEALPRNSLHQGYDWCHSWHTAHHSDLLVVRGRIDGRTVLILPLEAERQRGVVIAHFVAGRYNNINTGLLDEDFRYLDGKAVQIVATMLTTLLKGRADLMRFETVPLMWRDIAHPFTGLHAVQNANRTFQLPLLETFEQTLSQLNAKRRRKKFRLQERRLEERGGYEHVIPATQEDKHALMDLFYEQKAARFRTLGLPDAFRADATKAFFHDLLDSKCNGLDTPLELHAIRLKGQDEGRIAAIAGLSRKGDHVICQFGSIDDTLAPEASPGELLFWLMIERANKAGAAIFDFGIGDQPYKRSWCTVETLTFDLLIPVSLKGRIAMYALAAETRIKATIKRNNRPYSFLQRLRAGRQVPQQTTPAESE